ncbi:MAG: nucleotidyltransferase family protein [Renibacterium salmoninarum]|nr:nucleotidyltransferase family protein [Renibacterium salmoninarum]
MPPVPLAFDSRGANANRAYLALALGLVSRIAATRAIDAVVVKGAAAELTGLRPPRDFSDVDIMVRPVELEIFSSELERRGWIARPFEDRDNVFPKHSVSMYHPRWPIDIDVHYRFPGFEAEPESVIDEFLQDQLLLESGGMQLSMPSKLGCLVVQALHQLRSPWEPGASDALAELQRRSADLESARIIEFARRTRCLAALRPFLEQRPDFSPADVLFPEPSSEWRVRTLGEDSASIRIFTLIRAPWRQKPKLLWRAAFPSRTALAARDITLRGPRRKLPNVYLHRFLRFCSALPESIRAVRRLLAAEPKNPARQTIRSIPATDKTDRSRFSAR